MLGVEYFSVYDTKILLRCIISCSDSTTHKFSSFILNHSVSFFCNATHISYLTKIMLLMQSDICTNNKTVSKTRTFSGLEERIQHILLCVNLK